MQMVIWCSRTVRKCGCTDMAVVKHLAIKKGGTTYTCNVYDNRAEAGSAYFYYKVNGVEYDIPLCAVGEYRATPGRVKEHTGTQWAIATTGVPVYGKAEYRSPGTFTFTVPAGVTKLRVEVAGAGGSSAGGTDYWSGDDKEYRRGGKGGNGAKINTTISITPKTSINIVVGKGGNAPAFDKAGVAGGSSSVPGVAAGGGSGGAVSARFGKDGADGANAGNGLGGAGGAYGDAKGGGMAGSNGWVIIEYGQGVQ